MLRVLAVKDPLHKYLVKTEHNLGWLDYLITVQLMHRFLTFDPQFFEELAMSIHESCDHVAYPFDGPVVDLLAKKKEVHCKTTMSLGRHIKNMWF